MTHFCVIFFNFQKMQFFCAIAIAILIFSAPQFVTGVLVEKCRIEFPYFLTPKPLTNGTFFDYFFAFSKNAFFCLITTAVLIFRGPIHIRMYGRPAGRLSPESSGILVIFWRKKY